MDCEVWPTNLHVVFPSTSPSLPPMANNSSRWLETLPSLLTSTTVKLPSLTHFWGMGVSTSTKSARWTPISCNEKKALLSSPSAPTFSITPTILTLLIHLGIMILVGRFSESSAWLMEYVWLSVPQRVPWLNQSLFSEKLSSKILSL